jgi:hypothetical protein
MDVALHAEELIGAWEKAKRHIRSLVKPLVRRKIEKVAKEQELPKSFKRIVQASLENCLMEVEFADVQPPGLFHYLGFWYVQGHFPCGWDGCFPEGRLMVF